MIFFHSLKVTSEAEINNYDTSVDGSPLSHHDVFEFDITMNDPSLMTVIESTANFIHDFLGFALKHFSPRLLIDVVLKRSTLYELHEQYDASVR